MPLTGLDEEIVAFLRNNANQCAHELKRWPAGDYAERNELLRRERFMRFLLGEIASAEPDTDLVAVLQYQRECCRQAVQDGEDMKTMRKRLASYSRLLLRAGAGTG